MLEVSGELQLVSQKDLPVLFHGKECQIIIVTAADMEGFFRTLLSISGGTGRSVAKGIIRSLNFIDFASRLLTINTDVLVELLESGVKTPSREICQKTNYLPTAGIRMTTMQLTASWMKITMPQEITTWVISKCRCFQ